MSSMSIAVAAHTTTSVQRFMVEREISEVIADDCAYAQPPDTCG